MLREDKSIFRKGLEYVISEIPKLEGIEYIYPRIFNDIHKTDTLGVEGWMGISNHYFKI